MKININRQELIILICEIDPRSYKVTQHLLLKPFGDFNGKDATWQWNDRLLNKCSDKQLLEKYELLMSSKTNFKERVKLRDIRKIVNPESRKPSDLPLGEQLSPVQYCVYDNRDIGLQIDDKFIRIPEKFLLVTLHHLYPEVYEDKIYHMDLKAIVSLHATIASFVMLAHSCVQVLQSSKDNPEYEEYLKNLFELVNDANDYVAKTPQYRYW
jgi:hypothetical protein